VNKHVDFPTFLLAGLESNCCCFT